MKKHLKMTALILGAMMLNSAFLSCSNTDNVTTDTSIDNISDTADSQKITQKLQPDLPEKNFEGHEFKVLVRGESDGVWASQDIFAEEENGDPINDAVFTRNRYINEKYNVKITGIKSDKNTGNGSFLKAVKSIILAGDNVYDVLIPGMSDAGNLAMNNMLVDLKTVPYMDLSQPWWDKNAERDFSLGGKLFMTTGDISITDNNATRIMMFNKTLLNQYKLESPYELVKTNRWTIDKMIEMSKLVTEDLNGDSKYDENDQYGLLIQTGCIVSMYYNSGEKMTVKDENDYPEIAIDKPRSLEVLSKINQIFSASNDWIMFDSDYTHINSSPEHVLRKTFEENRGLFFTEVMQLLERMRSMESSFGVLPMPKLDENQKDYHHFADEWCMSLVCIPTTNTNLERTGILLEALAAESMYTLTPAYYDISLQDKFMRDEESSEMLDIILGTRVSDQTEMYKWGGMFTKIKDQMRKTNGNFASTIDSIKTKTEADIKKTIDAYNS